MYTNTNVNTNTNTKCKMQNTNNTVIESLWLSMVVAERGFDKDGDNQW